jgi:hypothetical protein
MWFRRPSPATSSVLNLYWSDMITPDQEDALPYYRCFDHIGRLVGYIRQSPRSKQPLWRAIVVCTRGSGAIDEEILAHYDTAENAKAAVEKQLL